MSDSSLIDTSKTNLWFKAAPFWVGAYAPVVLGLGAYLGGIWTWVAFMVIVYTHSLLDVIIEHSRERLDPTTQDALLLPYDILLKSWAAVQTAMLIAFLWYVPEAAHLNIFEEIMLAGALGAIFGLIGINYSHELMHRGAASSTWLADILLAMTCYGHFRTEHIQGHHIHVATPKDPATARLGESFTKFLPRVIKGTWRSAFRIEREKLARQSLPWWHHKNPFWRYWTLQGVFTILVLYMAGLHGLFLWWIAAFHGVAFLELTNYIEHYGLTRQRGANGKYEPTRPHHSWNSNERVSNWVLINLQRHSDHHYKPDRHFAMLEAYEPDVAPQLPYGYSLLAAIALLAPKRWRKMMDPLVEKWRRDFYPEVTDWSPSTRGASS